MKRNDRLDRLVNRTNFARPEQVAVLRRWQHAFRLGYYDECAAAERVILRFPGVHLA